jgi:hypothetical protein
VSVGEENLACDVSEATRLVVSLAGSHNLHENTDLSYSFGYA